MTKQQKARLAKIVYGIEKFHVRIQALANKLPDEERSSLRSVALDLDNVRIELDKLL